MRYTLMQDIAAGKLDGHLTLQMMLLEEGVAETMCSLQAHFRYYREPGTEFTYAPLVQDMFTGQALMRVLLAELTLACPQCGGEQEIVYTGKFPDPNFNWHVGLACGHAGVLVKPLPRRKGSGAVQ